MTSGAHLSADSFMGGKAGSVARSRGVNLTLIVIYKGKVHRTCRTTGLIHVNISVRR